MSGDAQLLQQDPLYQTSELPGHARLRIYVSRLVATTYCSESAFFSTSRSTFRLQLLAFAVPKPLIQPLEAKLQAERWRATAQTRVRLPAGPCCALAERRCRVRSAVKRWAPNCIRAGTTALSSFPAGPEGSRAGAHARRIQWPPASGPASSRRQPSGGCPGRRSALCSLSCGSVLSIGRLPRLRIAQYITADSCHSQLIHIDLDLCCLRRLAWALTQVACLTLLQPWDDLLPRLRLLEVLVSRAAKDHL